MANRRIRVSYGRICQTAPYENLRLDIAIEKDIEDKDIMSDKIDNLISGLQRIVKMKIVEILKNE